MAGHPARTRSKLDIQDAAKRAAACELESSKQAGPGNPAERSPSFPQRARTHTPDGVRKTVIIKWDDAHLLALVVLIVRIATLAIHLRQDCETGLKHAIVVYIL